MLRSLSAVSALVVAASAHAGFVTIDFTTDDFGTPLVNGQDISSPDEFGNLISISSSGNNQGAAIFDSDPMGPNMGGGDPDLLVGLGNLLIVQSNDSPTQTVPGIFDTPNDSAIGGEILFTISQPTQVLSVDLVDQNGGNGMTITLMDTMGLTRTYTVPAMWTNDVSSSPIGYGTLDFTTLADQPGEGSGGPATASEDMGFNPLAVVSVNYDFVGSGGLDNFTFVPTPGAIALAGLAGLAATRRKRD